MSLLMSYVKVMCMSPTLGVDACITENPYLQWAIVTVIGIGLCMMINDWRKSGRKGDKQKKVAAAKTVKTVKIEEGEADLDKAYEEDMQSLKRILAPSSKRRKSVS